MATSKRILRSIALCGLAGCAVAGCATAAHADSFAPSSLSASFAKPDLSSPVIGRVALQLVSENGSRQVGVGWRFHTGERFRFEVNSTRSGGLQIFHRSNKKEMSRLWPRADSPDKLD